MIQRTTSIAIFAILLLAAVSGFAQPNTFAPALLGTSNLPPVGLASTETAQINLVNTAPQSSSAPAPSCNGSVAFYNSSGTVIGTPFAFTVGTGQIMPVKLPFTSAGVSADRIVIRAEIVLTTIPPMGASGTAVPVPACMLAYSFETYDTSTGITHLFFSGATATAVRGQVFVQSGR